MEYRDALKSFWKNILNAQKTVILKVSNIIKLFNVIPILF